MNFDIIRLSNINKETQLKPVSKGERFEILDILRGFALYGVFIANMVWYFSGYGYIDSNVSASFGTASIDSISLELETFFVVNKFITIFSFLFGIGFAIQLDRVIKRNKKFTSFYVRRMIYLLLFGVIHFTFLLYTDILFMYAILGLLLILWRSMSNRQLLFWGIYFAVFLPVIFYSIIWLTPIIFGSEFNIEQAFNARWNHASTLHSSFINGSYIEVIKANLTDVFTWITTDGGITDAISSFGLFLLGFRVGRSNLLTRINNGLSIKERKNVLKATIWSLVIGIFCHGMTLLDIPIIIDEDLIWVRIIYKLLWRLGVLTLAIFYICTIILIYERNKSSRLLHFFTPVGRMALTNYIAQSVIGFFIFYRFGLGFYGQVGPAISIVLATIIFVFQALVSQWWLKQFRFGPLEWAWRSLTYGKLENMNHSEITNK